MFEVFALTLSLLVDMEVVLDDSLTEIKEEWGRLFNQWFEVQVLTKPLPGGKLPECPLRAFEEFHRFYEQKREKAGGCFMLRIC